MMNDFEQSYKDAMEFFKNKLLGSKEHETLVDMIEYIKQYNLEYEVFTTAYNFCDAESSIQDCIREIGYAMMDWDI